MDKIKMGVIGVGDIAFRRYLPAIREFADQVELVAVCDVDRPRADQVKVDWGAQQAFCDAEEMLARAELDAVMVLTPMVPHGPLSIAALEAGLHVYVEKVMAVEMDQADRMVELADERHLVLSCAPSTILLSAYQRAKTWIDAGEIGRVCFAHALGAHGGPARWDEYTSDPAWFYKPGGGPLFDLGVYPVQILTHYLGPARRVIAFSGLCLPELVMTPERVRGQKLQVQVDDTTPLILEFGNATFATVDVSYNVLSSRMPAMQFFGSAGSLTAPQFLGDEDWQIETVPPNRYDGLGLAGGFIHWLDCIHEGKQPINNGRHGQHVLEILLAAQESARTGQAVELCTTF